MKEILNLFLAVGIGLTCSLLLIFILVTPLNMLKCTSYEKNTGLETKYDVTGLTCYVKYEDTWYAKSELRGVRE